VSFGRSFDANEMQSQQQIRKRCIAGLLAMVIVDVHEEAIAIARGHFYSVHSLIYFLLN
jgi:hypothetical protein